MVMSRSIISTLTIILALTGIMNAQSPPPEKLPFNRVQYYVGSPDRDYDDAYLYFKYSGAPEMLLEEMEKAHQTPIAYNTTLGCYEMKYVAEPHWYYMSYRIRLDYTDEGIYKMWAQYEFDELVNPHTTEFDNGYIIHDISMDWISLYQGIVDRAMERSLEGGIVQED